MRLRFGRWAAALTTVLLLAPVPLAAPASAEEVSCLAIGPGDPRPVSRVASAPLEAIGATRAQSWLRRTGREPGDGTTVAVVSSGIAGGAGLRLGAGGTSLVGSGPVVDPTGTIVAGLVAAPARTEELPVGVAPGAEVVDVRVHDTLRPTQEGQLAPSVSTLAEGLAHVRDRVAGVDIVAIPLQLPRDERVESVVADLLGAGVVVVAQAGDRPERTAGESTGEATDTQVDVPVDPLADRLAALATPRPDEDAGPLVHPAGAAGVVAVGSVPDEVPAPLRSSAVDVVAPSLGAVSVSLAGGTCLLDEASSSWATGLVAGVLAMLRSAHPRDSVEELVARLVATADGRPDVRSPLTGAGTVSALAALTAPAGRPGSGGYASDTTVPRAGTTAAAPREPEDLLAGTRDGAVWWGVLGGGVLLLAVLARPLLAHRSG